MMSVWPSASTMPKAGRPVQLFKSHRDGIADGDQRRDFIYVDDVITVMHVAARVAAGERHLQCRHRQGTQLSRADARRLFAALGKKPDIEYVDMPDAIRGSYQYFTEAKTERLRAAGYNAGFTPLEEAVKSYVCGFLDHADPYR